MGKIEACSIQSSISETFPESTKLAFTRSKLLVIVQYCSQCCTNFLRTSSDTDRLLLQDSLAKKLVRVISALYQENYLKFEALVLISGTKPSTTNKFLVIVLSIILPGAKGRRAIVQWPPLLYHSLSQQFPTSLRPWSVSIVCLMLRTLDSISSFFIWGQQC